MSRIRIHLDEDCQARALAKALQAHGIDAKTTLHGRWLAAARSHSGIIVFPQQELSIGDVIRRLARLIHTLRAEEMCNRLEWLNAWGVPKTGAEGKHG